MNEHDDRLRRALREALPREDGEALQARVLAQWRQRHPDAATPVGVGLLGQHPTRWLGAAALASSLLVLAWCSVRPDPVMEELMQLDVLSQISLGEM